MINFSFNVYDLRIGRSYIFCNPSDASFVDITKVTNIPG